METVEVSKYKCPICGLEYNDERLVRAHISLSTDEEHKGVNGVMEEIHRVDDNENVLEKREGHGSIRGAGMDEDVPQKAFPPSITEKQLAILRTAVRNANVDSIKEIERRVEDFYDVDVSYQTVRKTVKNFFIVEEETTDDEREYNDLTAKQRAIVDVMAATNNLSYTEVANKVGVSQAYPQRVEDDFEELIRNREQELVAMPDEPEWTDEQERVIEELQEESAPLDPERDYDEIATAARVDVDTVSQLIHGHKGGVREETQKNGIGYQKRGMTASPDMKQFDPETQSLEDEQDEKEEDDEKQADGEEDLEQQELPVESDELASDVATLLQNVKSFRRVAETELEHDENNTVAAGKLAVAKEIESEIENIISN